MKGFKKKELLNGNLIGKSQHHWTDTWIAWRSGEVVHRRQKQCPKQPEDKLSIATFTTDDFFIFGYGVEYSGE